MSRTLRLGAQAAAVALVGALLALLVWKIVHGNGSSAASEIAKGKTPPAPAFSLARLDRPGRLELASLKGKGVVLNFWASWCIPCKQEAQELEAAWRRLGGQGLVVIGVDAQDFSGDARRFMRKHGVSYPVVHDGSGKTLGPYGVTGFPETFFVDRHGRLVGEHIEGPVDQGENKQKFQRGLALALRS